MNEFTASIFYLVFSGNKMRRLWIGYSTGDQQNNNNFLHTVFFYLGHSPGYYQAKVYIIKLKLCTYGVVVKVVA